MRGGSATLVLLALMAGCAHQELNGPWVHDIDIHGNRALSGGDIRDVIALEQTSWLPLAPRRPFDPLALEVDRKRIETYYQAHGFFLARVTDVQVVPRDDGESVDVEITVDEGPRTQVNWVEVRGLESLPEDKRRAVMESLPVQRGAFFDHARYLEMRQLVEARLRAAGHAWAAVVGQALVDRERQTVDVILEVQPGPEVHWGRVIVEDSDLEDEVRRRLRIEQGARFRPEDLDDSRARLRQVGRFSTVRVEAVPRLDDPSIADVVVRPQLGKLNDFKMGAGVGFESDRHEVRAPVVYTRYGFLGGFRTLTLRARPGWVVVPAFWDIRRMGPALRLDLTFNQPDFLVRDMTLRAQTGYDLGVDYAFQYHGPRGSLGVEYTLLGGHVVASASYNFQYLFFFNLAETPGDIFEDPALSRRFLGYTNPYRLGYLLTGAAVDYRDQALDPTRGFYFSPTLELGAPALGSQFSYQKVMGDLRAYYTILGRLTISGRAIYGAIFAGDSSSPITRRFYAGGSDSHRGFGYERLSPQVPSTSLGIGIPVGGDRQLLLQAELRANLFRIAGNWVGLAFFVDAGDVPQRDRDIDLAQLYIAVGPGLRYHTPIGVLRFDLGIRLNRLSPFQPDGRQNADPGDRFAWHINIGEAF